MGIALTRPLRVEYEEAFYHITARGNERKPIFRDARDRQEMLNILNDAKDCHGINVYAYVLMDNHYHLLIETPRANLVRFMHRLQTVYTNRFNSRHKRAGHLFQGRYKSILVEKENYLLELTRYIHLNPVRAGIARLPEEFQWSSYRSYLGIEKSPFLSTGWLLGQFSARNIKTAQLKYRAFVQDGLSDNFHNPFKDLYAGFILGAESFSRSVIHRIKERELSPEIPAQITGKLSPQVSDVKEAVLKEFGITEEELFRRRHNTRALKISFYLARLLTDAPVGVIAKELGSRHYSFVSQSAREIEEEMSKDTALSRLIESIEKKIRANSQLKT